MAKKGKIMRIKDVNVANEIVFTLFNGKTYRIDKKSQKIYGKSYENQTDKESMRLLKVIDDLRLMWKK